MIGLTAKIALRDIKKITIYTNPQKKTMAAIKKELGCDYIMNAGLFNMTTFKPQNMLTVGGKALSAGGNPFGFSFNGSAVAFSYENDVKYPDFIGAYPCLIRNGKKDFPSAPLGLSGDRGRSAIGVTKDCLVMRCVPDVTGASDFTLEELCADLLGAGCVNAINLDGGGSSQADFLGKKINSSRKVHNFICVWTKCASPAPPPTADKPSASLFPMKSIAAYQTWLNDAYKTGIAEDGSFGAATKKSSVKAMQKENGTAMDGSWGPTSRAAHKSFTVGTTGNRVVVLTALLFKLGLMGSITNTFDSTVLNAVKKFQRSVGLTADGWAGRDTFSKLFS